jgi:hypothetical protein
MIKKQIKHRKSRDITKELESNNQEEKDMFLKRRRRRG